MPHYMVKVSDWETKWRGPYEAANPEIATSKATVTAAETAVVVVEVAVDENNEPLIYERNDLDLPADSQ